jgi:hypothetical protein
MQMNHDNQNQEDASKTGEAKDRFRICPLCGTDNRYSTILDTHEEEEVETYPVGRWLITMRTDVFKCNLCHQMYVVSNSLWQRLDSPKASH